MWNVDIPRSCTYDVYKWALVEPSHQSVGLFTLHSSAPKTSLPEPPSVPSAPSAPFAHSAAQPVVTASSPPKFPEKQPESKLQACGLGFRVEISHFMLTVYSLLRVCTFQFFRFNALVESGLDSVVDVCNLGA